MTYKILRLCILSLTILLYPFSIRADDKQKTSFFNRIATFSSIDNVPKDRSSNQKSIAEIVSASEDGLMLVYTDSAQKAVGLVDIRDARAPLPKGLIAVGGEPTSVVISRGYAYVAIDETKEFKSPRGSLVAIDISTQKIITRCSLGGQPDSIAYDSKTRQLVVAIENQRDETLNKGAMPQMPAGFVSLVPLKNKLPVCEAISTLDVSGIALVTPEDPEPEFVKINSKSIAAVTLQENNHIVFIDLKTKKILTSINAGSSDLTGIDTQSNGVISLTENIKNIAREPDGIAWLDNNRVVIANEGDYKGGARSFSIFKIDGTLEYDSGNLLDTLAVQLGHYPEKRSRAKGSEPEGVEVGKFGNDRLIFVGAERASLVFVFKDEGPGRAPTYLQALPAGTAPEGLLAIPGRNLLITASENDSGARAGLMIYERKPGAPTYPSLMSGLNAWGQVIPWGAISGASRDLSSDDHLWAITDSAYSQARLLRIDVSKTPAAIVGELVVTKNGIPQALDGEGVVERETGGFWIVSEGDPTNKKSPTTNQLIRLSPFAEILEVIELPKTISEKATRFGFEGVTVIGKGNNETVVIAVQREWSDDPKGYTKILFYSPHSKEWSVLHYPLKVVDSKDMWVGISEITAISDTDFLVIERDNQFGNKAFKTLQRFSIKGIKPSALGDLRNNIPVVSKVLERDLVVDMKRTHGNVLDKIESFAELSRGRRFVITDNDGVDGSSGETMFIKIQ